MSLGGLIPLGGLVALGGLGVMGPAPDPGGPPGPGVGLGCLRPFGGMVCLGAMPGSLTPPPVSTVEYHVYGSPAPGDPIDYSTPIATTTDLIWTSPPLAYPGEHRFAVRAAWVDDPSLEEKNIDAAVRIVLDADGVDVTRVPAAPVGLNARPIGAGAIRVGWAVGGQNAALPAGFHVYATLWPGPMDWVSTPVATVAANRPRGGSYSAEVSGLSAGRHLIGVRAFNGTGEETNTNTVTVAVATSGPDPVVGLTSSTDPADWS